MNFLQNLIYFPPAFQIFLVLMSVLGLWYGSDKVIWAVKRIARKYGIPELIIGLTLVSIGSSLPEIFVNISAGLRGADDVGVGNIVGSCFVQISFILGICVLIGGSLKEKRENLKRDGLMLILANALVFFLGLSGHISALEGAFMMCVYILFVCYLIFDVSEMDLFFKGKFISAIRKRKKLKVQKSKSKMWLNVVGFLVGGFIIWISAEILLSIGLNAGEKMGISEGILGLLAGVGTSIPELSISLMAILRKSSGISVGNLIGSNITDPLFSLGIGAAFSNGYMVSDFMLYKAMPLWFMATVFAIGVFWFNKRMTRWPAFILVCFYLGSFWFLV